MEYLILSDSHRHPERIREVLHRQLRRPAGVFYLGDGVSDAVEAVQELPLYSVRGNCDAFLSPADTSPVECLIEKEGLRLLLVHGHLFNVHSGPGAAIAHAAALDADILLFGHTHEPLLEGIDAGERIGCHLLTHPLLICNPGSIGNGGSFAVLNIQNGIPHISLGIL